MQDNEGDDKNTHSVYVTHIYFAWRKWLREGALNVKVYTYINCLVFVTFFGGGGGGNLSAVQTLR